MKIRLIVIISFFAALGVTALLVQTPSLNAAVTKKSKNTATTVSQVKKPNANERIDRLEQQVLLLNEKLALALEKVKLLELTRSPSDEALGKQLLETEKKLQVLQQSGGSGTGKSRDEQLTGAVAIASPAVVSIVVSKDVPQLEVVYTNPFGNDPFFKDVRIRVPTYRQKGVKRQKVGAGTGFIVTVNGYILTNKHVVLDEDASYTVLLSDGSQKSSKVVYRDGALDIALIKIEGSSYPHVSLGNSDALKLGQTVIAIGNALGEYSNSVSVGIISGLNRNLQAGGGNGFVEKLKGMIQTDAAINPGNSGGPLLDLNGHVVGVNVATVVGSNNISFSIPINKIKEVTHSFFGKDL